MFRRKVKEDPTELQLLKIRVQNLEKEIAERSKKMDINTYNKESGQEAASQEKTADKKANIVTGNISVVDHWPVEMTRSSVEQLLTNALVKELTAPGEEVRTWFIDDLVDNLMKIQDQKQEAPQVQTEELESIVKLKLNGENFT